MDDIKTPEQLLEFMTSNISYGYLGKNGRVYHSDEELKKLIIKEFDKPNEHISAGEYIDFVLGN